MTVGVFNGTAFALSGNTVVVAPLASVAVRRESDGALATIYSDHDGTVGLTNPLTADSSGRFSFYAAALDDGYRITVTEAGSPGASYTLRHVPMGTAQYRDVGDFGDSLLATDDADAVKVLLELAKTMSAGFNLEGGYLDWTVVGSPTSTLTVSIKTYDGNDPSAGDPVYISFRSSTVGTGSLTRRAITAATSITINSSALLGTVSNIPFRLWCVAFDDSGTIRLALINCLSTSAGAGSGRDVTTIYPLAAWGIASATLEADTSDSAQVFYSNGASVSAKAYATLGFASWESGLPNAGNWNSNPTRIQLYGPGVPLPGQVVQRARNDTGAVATGTTLIPADDTIPQIAEGDQYMTQSITPSSTANALHVRAHLAVSPSVDSTPGAALYQDAVSNSLKAISEGTQAGFAIWIELDHLMLAATASATTLRARAGMNTAGTLTFNGVGGARLYGGVRNSFMEVTEVMA